MTKNNHITTKRSFKHLSDIMRGRLEELSKLSLTQSQMAKELGVSQSTISRELKRGRTKQRASNYKYYECYLADAGARVYRENRSRSCAKDISKYSSMFFEMLPKAITGKYRIFSVDTFVEYFRRENPNEKVPCTKTVYTLIDNGVLSIRNIDLPMKTRIRPRKKKKSDYKGTNKKKLGRSIEERDASILERIEFGHWELDLIIGSKFKGEPVIITLVERKTRFLITKKVWAKDAQAIQKAVEDLIKKHGLEKFQTITTDNGSEFSTLSVLENNVKTLQIYYTHAFASWEKGSNERHNRMLREFLPKGTSFKGLKYSDLQLYTTIINDRTRKKLKYESPSELFEKEITKQTAA